MKLFSALLLTIIAGLALTVPASASTRATGPFILKAQSANVCVKATPNRPGTAVIQGDYSEGDCRKLFFDRIGFVNGNPYGEWETAGGRTALSSLNCSTVTLQATHATGTSWVTYILGGGHPIKLINKRCDGNIGNSDCVEALAATGDIGAPWFVINWRQNPGYFTSMHIIQTSAGPRTSRAGC